jgi:hypothetical protein
MEKPSFVPPRTKAIYEEYIATKGLFGYDPFKMWNFMESLEIETIEQRNRIEELECLLSEILEQTS